MSKTYDARQNDGRQCVQSERKLDLAAIKSLVIAGWTGRDEGGVVARITSRSLPPSACRGRSSVPVFYRNGALT